MTDWLDVGVIFEDLEASIRDAAKDAGGDKGVISGLSKVLIEAGELLGALQSESLDG